MAEYLVFTLGQRSYGISATHVLEIVAMPPITRVPRAGEHVLGVVNLRGKVVPVVDLARRLGLAPGEAPRRSVVVLRLESPLSGSVLAGVRVDEVSDVVELSADEIEPPPSLGESDAPVGVEGLARRDDRSILILDAPRLVLGGFHPEGGSHRPSPGR